MKGLFASKALAVAGVMIAAVLGFSTVRADDTRIIVVSHDQANDRLCHAGVGLLSPHKRGSRGHEKDQLCRISVPA
jgi:hypothetical protein